MQTETSAAASSSFSMPSSSHASSNNMDSMEIVEQNESDQQASVANNLILFNSSSQPASSSSSTEYNSATQQPPAVTTVNLPQNGAPSNQVVQEHKIQLQLVEVAEQISQIMSGTHPDYLAQCKKLESVKSDRISLAEKYKAIQLEAIQHNFNCELQQAQQDFENDVTLLRENMLTSLLEKQKKLSEEKNGTDESEKSTRKLRKRYAAKEETPKPSINNTTYSYESYTKKKRIPAALNVNFTLGYEEITDDLSFIKRSGGKV